MLKLSGYDNADDDGVDEDYDLNLDSDVSELIAHHL